LRKVFPDLTEIAPGAEPFQVLERAVEMPTRQEVETALAR
jgi:hypothetical protein